MKYRADIDGIRAIAVTVVILFHFGVPGFAGGFVGVDIFFVLSGYLISSIIFSQLDNKRFEFVDFYFRRIRRLMPVYVVVMLCTLVACYIYMLPTDFAQFGQSLFASTVYASNILFFWEAGYFDTESHLKPLLHTWSLSVEEQFYLVFPVLAFFTAFLNHNRRLILFSLLTLASFIAALWYIQLDASAVFFLYPFRAWEMFLGTVLATGMIPQIKRPSANNLVALVGLALLIYPTFVYDKYTVFPGLNALAPCLGTLMLLHSGGNDRSWLSKLLSSAGPVLVGKLSYSLYLWHWPVFVLYHYNSPEGLNARDIVLMVILTFVFSALSYRYIENPIRHGAFTASKSKRVVFGSTIAVSIAFMVAGFAIYKSQGLPARLDPLTAQFARAANDLFGDFTNCFNQDNPQLPGVEYCGIGDPLNSKGYTLFWGDSHGAAYKRGYQNLIENKDHPALIAWTGGCAPVIGFNKDESVSSAKVDAFCRQRNQAITELVAQDKRINAVVLVGRWSYYLNGGGVGVDASNRISIWPDGKQADTVDDPAAYFISALAATVNSLNSLGLKVFIVEQPPEFEDYIARSLAIKLMHKSAGFEQSLTKIASEDYAAVLARQGRILELINDLEAKNKVTVLRTHEFFCAQDNCYSIIDGAPTYFDNNHVSSSGAVVIRSMFAPLLDYLEKK